MGSPSAPPHDLARDLERIPECVFEHYHPMTYDAGGVQRPEYPDRDAVIDAIYRPHRDDAENHWLTAIERGYSLPRIVTHRVGEFAWVWALSDVDVELVGVRERNP